MYECLLIEIYWVFFVLYVGNGWEDLIGIFIWSGVVNVLIFLFLVYIWLVIVGYVLFFYFLLISFESVCWSIYVCYLVIISCYVLWIIVWLNYKY